MLGIGPLIGDTRVSPLVLILGHELKSSRFFATFSADARYIICSSEDRQCVIWDTYSDSSTQHFSGLLSGVMQWQADAVKTSGHERFMAATEPITFAMFSPTNRNCHVEEKLPYNGLPTTSTGTENMVVIVAEVNGKIRVFENDFSAGNLSAETLIPSSRPPDLHLVQSSGR